MADIEHAREDRPLLATKRSYRPYLPSIQINNWLNPGAEDRYYVRSSREQTKHFLSSKAGHYSVLGLVILDVSAIIVSFVIELFKCEDHWGSKVWDDALETLGIISLVFSCLFMVELLASIWAFGFRFFRSKFHCFDAVVIVAGFISDIVLRGVDEEAASLVVILRLWRLFKIIEELSAGAQDQLDALEEKIQDLEKANESLKAENVHLKSTPAA